MGNKIVRLSVHKNTLIQRKRKELRAAGIKSFKDAVNNKDISGYMFVSWNKDGSTQATYNLSDDSKYRVIDIPPLVESLLKDHY